MILSPNIIYKDVICIDKYHNGQVYADLIIGETYRVIVYDDSIYYVTNVGYFSSKNFVSIEEYRNIKLDDIGI
jgi:hypothetical protein